MDYQAFEQVHRQFIKLLLLAFEPRVPAAVQHLHAGVEYVAIAVFVS